MEEKRESNGTWQPFVVGLVAGAAVGGLLGILFAPRSGKETRDKIGEFAHKVEEKVGEVAHNAREKVAGHSGEDYSGLYPKN